MAKGHPEAGFCQVTSSATWHQAAPQPPLPSAPAPAKSRCQSKGELSISRDALHGWLKIRDPRAELTLAKEKGHADCSQSRSVSGLMTVQPEPHCHSDSGAPLHCPLLLANTKEGRPLTKMFSKRWRRFRCCPRHAASSLTSAYIHLHVKLPSGTLQPPGHLLHVQQAPSQDRQRTSRLVLAEWKQKAISTAQGLTRRGQRLPREVSQLDKMLL